MDSSAFAGSSWNIADHPAYARHLAEQSREPRNVEYVTCPRCSGMACVDAFDVLQGDGTWAKAIIIRCRRIKGNCAAATRLDADATPVPFKPSAPRELYRAEGGNRHFNPHVRRRRKTAATATETRRDKPMARQPMCRACGKNPPHYKGFCKPCWAAKCAHKKEAGTVAGDGPRKRKNDAPPQSPVILLFQSADVRAFLAQPEGVQQALRMLIAAEKENRLQLDPNDERRNA